MADFALTGTFTATGQSQGVVMDGIGDRAVVRVNVTAWGTFVATFQPEISFDGTTWLQITDNGAPITRSAPCTDVFEESEAGVMIRLNCTAFTSGTVNYRISY